MAKLKRTSNTNYKARYTGYKAQNRAEKNKIKKLERHCRKFPDDEQAAKSLAALKKSGFKYKTTPKNSLYPIVDVQVNKNKKGEDKVRITRISRSYAISLARSRRAANAASFNELHYMTPEQLKAYKAQQRSRNKYGLDDESKDALTEFKKSLSSAG